MATNDATSPETKTCPVCRAPDATYIVRAKDHDVYRCPGCGTHFVDPLPSATTQHALYDDPYAQATTGYYAKAEKKLRRSRRRARLINRFARNPGAFLEVGASGGFMVEAMRELGYTATGVEPDQPGVAYARAHFPQNTFHNGLLSEVASKLDRYDVIYCSEVIEHVPDPRGFVATLAEHLKLGGLLAITTPDVSHWNKPADISRWKEFGPPGHCIYFTPKALRWLLAAHGLAVFHQRFNWKAGIQFFARKVYLSGPASGRQH